MLRQSMFNEEEPTGELSLEWFFKKRLEDTKSDEAKKKRERSLKTETLDWRKLDKTLKPLVADFSEILDELGIDRSELLKVTVNNDTFSKSSANIADKKYNNLETIVLSHIVLSYGYYIGSSLSRFMLGTVDAVGKKEGSILFENDHFILTFWEGQGVNHPEILSKVNYEFSTSSDKRGYDSFVTELYEELSVFTRGNVEMDEETKKISLGDINAEITVNIVDSVYSKKKGFVGMVRNASGDDCAIFNLSREWFFVNYDHEMAVWSVH